MALVGCQECGREISDKAAACPGCGAPQRVQPQVPPQVDRSQAMHSVPATKSPPSSQLPASSRAMYIVLSLLFGTVGFNDFYIGKFGLGMAKIAALGVSLVMEPIVFAALFCLLALLSILQAFTVRHDSKGAPLA